MPQTDIDRILAAIDALRAELGSIKVEFVEQITRLEERQQQQERTIQDHRTSLATLEATKATSLAVERISADLSAMKSQVKTIEDDALIEKTRRRIWGMILAAGGGIVSLLIKALISSLPKLF